MEGKGGQRRAEMKARGERKWSDAFLFHHLGMSAICIANSSQKPTEYSMSSLILVSVIFSERELRFRFAICRRPSVCLSSVCNVGAPYSAG